MPSSELTLLPAAPSIADNDLFYAVPAAGGAQYKATRSQVLTAAPPVAGAGINIALTASNAVSGNTNGGSVTISTGDPAGLGSYGQLNILPSDANWEFDVLGTAAGLVTVSSAFGALQFQSGGAFQFNSTTNRFAIVPSLNQVSLGSGQSLGWSSTTDATAAIDTSLTRLTAGVVRTPTLSVDLVKSAAGSDLTILGLTPVQIAATEAGSNVAITASNATAGASVISAAGGGSVDVITGNAARFTSGDANGGNFTITLGSGIGSGAIGKAIVADTGGTNRFAIVPSLNQVSLGSGQSLGWSSTTNATAAVDTQFTRISASVIGFGVGSNATLKAQPPLATTGASQVGRHMSLYASDAVASTDTNGAAVGGSLNLASGSAARLVSGNANGGDISNFLASGVGTGTAGIWYVADVSGNRFAVVPGLSQVGLGSSEKLGWSSSDATAAIDAGIIRLAAASIKVTDGAAGTGSLTANIDAANITSGTINTARLGSGVADNTKFLRGDSTWQVFTTGTVTNVTATLPVTSTGGATPDIGFNSSNILAQQWFGG